MPVCLPHRVKDLSGKVFGRLAVAGFDSLNGGRAAWRCVCECGKTRVVLASALTTGHTKSCGCKIRDINRARLTTHGDSRTPEYKAWARMIQRCHNPAYKRWADYGGRGIVVCDRWRESFEAFREDMGPRPSPAHSIDRRENDKGYGPDNCRWATRAEQQNNTRRNRRLTINGRTQTVTAWAVELGVKTHTICTRLARGWSVERTLTTGCS